MDQVKFKPKRKSLLDAVEAAVGGTLDHSTGYVKLVGISEKEFQVGDRFIIPFQEGASETCYALKLVFCDENEDYSVEIINHHVSKAKIEEWADRLWDAWLKNENE